MEKQIQRQLWKTLGLPEPTFQIDTGGKSIHSYWVFTEPIPVEPESIFEDAEFPFTVEIISEDEEITDVSLQIIPPKDIEFRGETMHSFSSIQKNSPVSVTAQILTPTTEVVNESKIPFQVKLTYVDEEEEEKTDSQTISLLLRPRTFMELTTDGGIWIGSFFLAPYISIGTIVGIPVGLIFSLLVRRSQNKKKRKKTTKTK